MKTFTIPVRLQPEMSSALQVVAERYCNTLAGTIRMAVKRLLEAEGVALGHEGEETTEEEEAA